NQISSCLLQDSSACKDLRQENHVLLQKLRLAESMEAAYQDEIEHLKEALKSAESSRSNGDPARSQSYEDEVKILRERLEQSEEETRTLSQKLGDSERQCAIVQERLASTESLLERLVTESSSNTAADLNTPDPIALMDAITDLKEDVSKAEAAYQTMRSKLERQLLESEDDRAYLQNHANELERLLGEARNELGDLRAQFEALQLQRNTTENTRGNSAFSEVEDRRIRAEKLVLQQRREIEELQRNIKKIELESNNKLVETVSKLEVRYRDRDTKFVDELVAERTRLITENSQLTRRNQQLEELQLDNERNAVKMSKAFGLEGSCQDNLIKTLEQRISVLQRALMKKSAAVDGLRERLLNASLLRRQMQAELWQQKDARARLSERNKELLKQLELREKTNDAGLATPAKPMKHAEMERTPSELVEKNSSEKENASPRMPSNVEHHLDRQSNIQTEVQEMELPASCRPS
ncbi:Tropomyosin, partial [Fasciolopsis buskii]